MFINLLEATVISLSTLVCDHRADLSNVSCWSTKHSTSMQSWKVCEFVATSMWKLL